jgi:hypothetical protein
MELKDRFYNSMGLFEFVRRYYLLGLGGPSFKDAIRYFVRQLKLLRLEDEEIYRIPPPN